MGGVRRLTTWSVRRLDTTRINTNIQNEMLANRIQHQNEKNNIWSLSGAYAKNTDSFNIRKSIHVIGYSNMAKKTLWSPLRCWKSLWQCSKYIPDIKNPQETRSGYFTSMNVCIRTHSRTLIHRVCVIHVQSESQESTHKLQRHSCTGTGMFTQSSQFSSQGFT